MSLPVTLEGYSKTTVTSPRQMLLRKGWHRARQSQASRAVKLRANAAELRVYSRSFVQLLNPRHRAHCWPQHQAGDEVWWWQQQARSPRGAQQQQTSTATHGKLAQQMIAQLMLPSWCVTAEVSAGRG